MQDWLINYELDTGKRKIKPYDPDIGKQIAEMLRPSMGEQIPTSADDIVKAFGRGWWKPDPQAASELLQAAGFTRRATSRSWSTTPVRYGRWRHRAMPEPAAARILMAAGM